jgi:hypothetical protein
MSYTEERNAFFNIRKEKVLTDTGIEIPNKVALVNADLGSVVGFVSPGYDVVENRVIAEMFDAATRDYKVQSVKDHLDNTTRRWKRQVIFDKDSFGVDVLPSDVVGVMLEVYNGYDARTSYGYTLMGYRWACTNGMIMGKKELMSESYAHYDGNVEKLRESFGVKFNLFEKNTKVWQKWSCEGFDQDEFDKFVNTYTKPENGRARKNQYLTPRISQTVKDSYQPLLAQQNLDATKWGAFNVLTWLATHETKARGGSNLFSNRYQTYARLAGDFYNDGERQLVIS